MKLHSRSIHLVFAVLISTVAQLGFSTAGETPQIPAANATHASEVIQLSVTLPISVEKSFELFTTRDGLTSWFAPIANVKPEIGGAFEMYFDPSDTAHNNSKGCKITALVPNKLLAFDWKGPRQFENLMENADPMPQVVVTFLPCNPSNSCTEIQLFHSGFHSSWQSTPTWQGPRDWFEPIWVEAFDMLKETATTGKKCFD